MASVFFPERMDYVELVSPVQSAAALIKEIAENGRIQLVDNNTGNKSVDKRYTEVYLQCEEASRSLSFMKTQLTATKKLPPQPKVQQALSQTSDQTLQEVVNTILQADSELREKTTMYERIKDQLKQLREKNALLEFYIPNLDQDDMQDRSEVSESTMSLPHNDNMEMSSFNNLPSCCGYVANESIQRLQKIILRVTRRNAVIHFGNSNAKTTPFLVFVSSTVALQKIKAIAQSFSKNVYEFPTQPEEIQKLQQEISAEITQTRNIALQARNANFQYLDEVAGNYWNWDMRIVRESQIWSTIDFGDFSREEGYVYYNGWMPRRFINELGPLADRATHAAESPIQIRVNNTPAESTKLDPPTFIETNNFSFSFQLFNDAYGVPNYNEMNAGAFYCMYPFLFGIMFGDMGHSIFYIAVTIGMFLMVPIMKKKGNNMGGLLDMVDKLKWFLLFASVSSFYCGFLYNETFSLPINFFGSRWEEVKIPGASTTYWKRKDNTVYPFGMDPAWFFKDNELIFSNSFKMKMSVIIGMAQMIFGLILAFINNFVNREWEEIICHRIPEFLYLVPFYGYMVVIIIWKWCTKFEGNSFFDTEVQQDGVNLIQVMIGMILSFGKRDSALHLYRGQWAAQTVITIIFFISIPLFLILKPCFDAFNHHGEPGFSVLETIVMNLIHVIEFVLQALSHTASYLRLWALSLAHSQLSKVIWEQLFLLGFNQNPKIAWLITFIVFLAFTVMTAAILLGMEAFSALLHGIRLMWVEFCSKFYQGTGYEFKPVSLKNTLKNAGYSEY